MNPLGRVNYYHLHSYILKKLIHLKCSKEMQNWRKTPKGGVYCWKIRKHSVVNGLNGKLIIARRISKVDEKNELALRVTPSKPRQHRMKFFAISTATSLLCIDGDTFSTPKLVKKFPSSNSISLNFSSELKYYFRHATIF